MAEFPVPSSSESTRGSGASGNPPISSALLAYALFGVGAVAGLVSSGFPVIAPLMGLIGIIGLIVCYVKRGDAAGTWVASHFRWLIRTFWYSLLWAVIGWVVAVTIIGIPVAFLIWAVAAIWVIYRVVRGYLAFNDSKPIPGM